MSSREVPACQGLVPAPPPSLHPSNPGSSLCPPSHPARKRQLDNSQTICNPRTLTPQLAPSPSSYQRKHAAWSVTASFSGPFPDTTQDPPGRGNTPPGNLPDAPAQPLSGWRLGAQSSSSGPAKPAALTCPGLRPFSCGQPSSAPTRVEPRYPQLWLGDLPPADCPASLSPSPILRSLPKHHVRPVLVSGHLGEPRPSVLAVQGSLSKHNSWAIVCLGRVAGLGRSPRGPGRGLPETDRRESSPPPRQAPGRSPPGSQPSTRRT